MRNPTPKSRFRIRSTGKTMTTHNNPEEEVLTPEASNSTPTSNPIPDSRTETAESNLSGKPEANPIAQQSYGRKDTGSAPIHARPFVSEKAPRVKKPMLGLALFTSGISLGVLGCGLVLAKGPFADLAMRLEPLAERGLTGGSLILTGMVLTAMAIVERQLRKQDKSLKSQEANAAVLKDIIGSVTALNTRFDEVQTSELQVFTEANTMRNELHQFLVNQEGKVDQSGIFHVAASVDKLSAQVDRALKGFGTEIQDRLRIAQEHANATHHRLEAKLQELEPQEVPDNSDLVAAQTNVVERLQTMEADLRETRSQMAQFGDRVQSNVQEILNEKLTDLKPQETYDDSIVLAGQSELGERLCQMEESFRSTQQRLSEIGESVQNTVQEKLQELQSQETYDDTAVLVGQSEIGDRLCAMEDNLRGTQQCIDNIGNIGETVQTTVLEALQGLQPQEAHDDSAVLASQTEIVGRLKALEDHLETTRACFEEAQEAIQCSVQDTMQHTVQNAIDSSIDRLRSELEQVSATVESAVESAVKGALECAPATPSTASVEQEEDQQALQAFLTSEHMGSPEVQTWPMEDQGGVPKARGVQENPPLEILHMPTKDEMSSAINKEQEQDSMAHALNHLFQPTTPNEENELDISEELFLDHIPQRVQPPHAPDTTHEATDNNHDSPESSLPFSTSGPSPIPGTPGSPFPAPIPLKPDDSDDATDTHNEGPSQFRKPYEPPSDDTGFRFPGWN
ncbi:MAG: hypothetical protein ACI87O_001285 [Planctomycetota bacterium]|jgi:hypothetical protein